MAAALFLALASCSDDSLVSQNPTWFAPASGVGLLEYGYQLSLDETGYRESCAYPAVRTARADACEGSGRRRFPFDHAAHGEGLAGVERFCAEQADEVVSYNCEKFERAFACMGHSGDPEACSGFLTERNASRSDLLLLRMSTGGYCGSGGCSSPWMLFQRDGSGALEPRLFGRGGLVALSGAVGNQTLTWVELLDDGEHRLHLYDGETFAFRCHGVPAAKPLMDEDDLGRLDMSCP